MIDETGNEALGYGEGFGPNEVPETTGRYVVTLRDDDMEAGFASLRSLAGADLARAEDYADSKVDMAEVDSAGGLFLSELGVAVVTAEPARARSFRAAGDPRVLAVEPERVHRTRGGEYVRGYRDGVDDLASRLAPGESSRAGGAADAGTADFTDTADSTWGLKATKAVTSSQSGAGVRVAVLDTGFTTDHPDFVGRSIVTQSFISGESVEDGHGHGTHCIGTACGSKAPTGAPRYGVAYESDILVGKVLSNAGSGSDAGILAAIAWALAKGADVISMSLGADVKMVSQAYTQVGRRALGRGSLIVAAAGNNARRQAGNPGFVGIPANAPTIMAVGAVDSSLDIAFFSARSNPVRGGQIDIAGPGVGVFSSWKAPEGHRSISGTSMATPHVAGVAALWNQHAARRGWELWATLAAESTRLGLPSLDVGGGLVVAPQ